MAKVELLLHPKWLRLEHQLRHVPRAHLLGHFEMLLHSTYSQQHPDFRSVEDLEFAAGWVGEPGELGGALEKWGFIDRVGEVLRVHDWLDHAPRTVQRRRAVQEWALRAGIPIPASASRGGVDGHGHRVTGGLASAGREAGDERTASGRPLAPYPDPDPDPDPIGTPSAVGVAIEEPTAGEKPKRFRPPSIEEVAELCIEKGYSVDAEAFVDFYESNGWRVGKNPMRNWQAAVRTWARRHRQGADALSPGRDRRDLDAERENARLQAMFEEVS